MKTFYAAQATDDNHISRGKFMTKKLKKILSRAKQIKALQKNAVKLYVFSTQLTNLIDAIPYAILLKAREGRKLITNKLTKRLFKLHDFDWYGKKPRRLKRYAPIMRMALVLSQLYSDG